MSGKSTAPHLQALLDVASIQQHGIAVLDGGFATHLEDALGLDISSSPLWSAALLGDDEQGCKAIKQTHVDFLDAGADIISTSTYQASTLTMQKAGYTHGQARELMIKSVTLCIEARDEWWNKNEGQSRQQHKPLIALSLGPYGAALCNGAEYTGEYSSFSGKAEPPTSQDLEDFHYERLREIASTQPTWQQIDLLAFETLPRIDEASAIRRALERLYTGPTDGASHVLTRKAALASFVFPAVSTIDMCSIPWDGLKQGSKGRDISTIDEVADMIVGTTFGEESSPHCLPFDAVGINCTKPHFLRRIASALSIAAKKVASVRTRMIFLYPDGGLDWDGRARVWKIPSEGKDSLDGADHWADSLVDTAEGLQRDAKSERKWAACFVGGCCKSTTADIAALRKKVDCIS